MAEETVDTNPDIYPAGKAILTCEKVVKKLSDSNKPYYMFTFEGVVDGVMRKHIEVRQPWMSGDLIPLLGGKATDKKGIYTWDKENAKGKTIDCVIIHEPDFKDKTKTRARITNPTEAIPF
jgi:hypothetical protein